MHKLLVATAALLGPAAAQPTFEVASVKPQALIAGKPGFVGIRVSGNTLHAETQSLSGLVTYAYGVEDFRVSGGPSWVYSRDLYGSDTYEVLAKAEGETAPTQDQFMQMLQGLLADRFQLKIHRETKEMPAYELVILKNGHKLKQATADPGAHTVWNSGSPERYHGKKVSMAELIFLLRVQAGRPVIDKTGLTGIYDFELIWSAGDPPPADARKVKIFEGVQEDRVLWTLDMKESPWARLLAYVTGLINQELLLQNEYLAAENRILRAHLPARLRLSDPERSTLAEIGKRLGRKALVQVACVAKPDTILAWYRRLIAKKFDGSKHRRYPGRPPIEPKLEELIVKMARENSGWGYDRIVGALSNLGYTVSDQTVGNVLKRHGIAPAPKRRQNTTWKEFIQSHLAVLAGIDFFTVEVLTWRGLVTYYVLFFIHLESRRVSLAGITRHPDQAWMQQMARNATGETWGFLDQRQYALHDHDTKFCAVFRATLAAGGIEPIRLPARSPNLNSHAERWVRSVKGECLSKLILFGEASLRRALTDFIDHFHAERNHQGKGNVLLFPSEKVGQRKPRSRVRCHERLDGILKYYSYVA